MRKCTAIIFLSVFLTLQYGRLVSYWHCQIISITNPSAPCDCEKILSALSVDPGHPMTANVNKDKIEEVNLFLESRNEKYLKEVSLNINSPVINLLVPQAHTAAIFQPPRA
jgi:hypothetical protein